MLTLIRRFFIYRARLRLYKHPELLCVQARRQIWLETL
jgi:hypothetical protein